jgi:hypothetical protein
MLDATIACREQGVLKQCGADTMALPGLLDAERGLGLLPSMKKPCRTTSGPRAVAA